MKRKFKPWMLAPISAGVICIIGLSVLLGTGGAGRQSAQIRMNAMLAGESSQGSSGPAGVKQAPRMPMPAATAAPAEEPPVSYDAADSIRKELEARSGSQPAGGFAGAEMPAATRAASEQKLIYRANIVVETREYDKCKAQIESMLAKYGGYVEHSQENGVPEGYDSKQGRTMTVSLRIPVSKYADAMAELQAMGILLQKYENTEDVGSRYVDTKARLDELIKSREKYMALLDKADNTESIIALQDAITDLTIRIEQDTAQLRYWDGQVAYSTITVEMRELVIPTGIATANPTSLGDRASGAFYETLSGMKKGLEDFAVWFVGAILWLCVIVVLAAVLLIVIFSATRKARKAAKAAEAKKSEDKQ